MVSVCADPPERQALRSSQLTAIRPRPQSDTQNIPAVMSVNKVLRHQIPPDAEGLRLPHDRHGVFTHTRWRSAQRFGACRSAVALRWCLCLEQRKQEKQFSFARRCVCRAVGRIASSLGSASGFLATSGETARRDSGESRGDLRGRFARTRTGWEHRRRGCRRNRGIQSHSGRSWVSFLLVRSDPALTRLESQNPWAISSEPTGRPNLPRSDPHAPRHCHRRARTASFRLPDWLRSKICSPT